MSLDAAQVGRGTPHRLYLMWLRSCAEHHTPLWREVVGLVLLACACAVVAWAVRSPRLPLRADLAAYALDLGAPLLSPAAAVALYDSGRCLVVDTRTRGRGEAYVPGAFLIRLASFDDDLAASRDFISRDDSLLLYGEGNLLETAAVTARLRQRGFGNLLVLNGDLAAWQRAGGPVATAGVTGAESDHAAEKNGAGGNDD